MKQDKNYKEFYGTATLGKKGQVIIPVEARKAFKINKGDKLLVFGLKENMLIFSKLANLEKFASHFSQQLKKIKKIIEKSKI